MAKKNETILNLLVSSPWWVSVILSAVAYIALKYILPSLFTDNIMLQGFTKGISRLAPLVALVLLIPAPISAYNSFRKRQLLDKQQGIQSIRNLSWKEFEELVGETYRRKGYTVVENSSKGADGGIDIRLKKDGQLHLVQCKQWRTQKVGLSVVREMFGIMTAENAASAIIISSGIFTQEAKNFASDKPIDLVDGAQLESLIKQIRQPK